MNFSTASYPLLLKAIGESGVEEGWRVKDRELDGINRRWTCARVGSWMQRKSLIERIWLKAKKQIRKENKKKWMRSFLPFIRKTCTGPHHH